MQRPTASAENTPLPVAARADTIELAVLDAPILARGALTLFLLHLAEAGAFDPVWSDQIHADWTRDLQRLRPDIPMERIRHRRLEMDRAFPVANVIASRDAQDEVLAHCTTPAERKNAHVLATALSARAAVIVTGDSFCLTEVMSKLWHDTAVLSPDAWCLELLAHQPEALLAGCRAHRASLTVRAAGTPGGGPIGGPAGGPIGGPIGGPTGGPTGGPIGDHPIGDHPIGNPIGFPIGGPAGALADTANAGVESWLALLRGSHLGLPMTAARLANMAGSL